MRFRRIGVLIGLLWSVSAVRLHAAGDFSLSASPSLQTVVAGASTTCTITVTKSGGFSGVVSFNTSGLTAGAAASFSPATVTGSGTTTMTVSTTTSTPAVTSTLTVTGTSGSLVHTTTTTLKVVGYSLAASPGSQSVSQGATSSPYTVTVTPANGFNGTVSFSVTGLPTGATAAFNPASVSGGSGSTAMTVTVGASTPAGNSTLTITGTSGTSNRTTTVTLVVTGPPITYIYDAVGRLTGVIDPSGEKAIYTYDAVGNLLSIARQGPSVSIVSFTPASGPVGTQVTITGTGFSSQASQNTVKFFNNVTATVTSAATTQIVTSVPSGAATGPITVTSPSGTVTSSASFTVASTPGPPTISGFTPNIATSSTLITISGTNFDLDPSKNTVKFNGNTATVVSSTGATLTTSVPQQATSGRITVQTPFGQATSSADFFVVPSPYAPANVSFTGRISVNGPALTVNLLAADQIGIVLFDGTQGQGLDLLTTFLQTPGLCLGQPSVKDPNGQTFFFTALPTTGTYSILIPPGYKCGGGRMTMRLVELPSTADFGIFALPDFPPLTATSVTYSVFLGPGTGWNWSQNINLSVAGVPAGATATISPSVATITSSPKLSVNLTSAISPGSYTLTITGVSGAISHSTTVTLNVNPVPSPWTSGDIGSGQIPGRSEYSGGLFTVRGSGADSCFFFICNPPDAFQYVYQSLSGDGVITARLIDFLNASDYRDSKVGLMMRESVTVERPPYAFVGLNGGLPYWNSGRVNEFQYRPATDAAYSFTSGSAGVVPYWFRLVRQGSSVSAWTSPDGAAWSQIGSTATIPMASSAYVGLGVWSQDNSVLATGVFDSVSVTSGPEFVLGAAPLTQPVTVGSSGSYTVTVSALNNFAEPVSLSVTGLPAGAVATFSPQTITGSGTSTMSVTAGSSTPFGTYPLTITGTSATKSHSVPVSLVVGPPDFTISASPASQTALVLTTTSYTVTVGSVGGFAGPVTLSAAGVPAGTTATFTPSSLTAPGSATLAVTIGSNTAGRMYPLTINGASGALSHSTTVNLIVPPPDFGVSISSPWLKLPAAGGTGTRTVTINAVNGFSKIVNLNVAGLPAGASGTFNPASVTGSGSSTLTLITTAGVPPGSYTLTITGTSPDALSGNPAHSVTMALIVDATTGALPSGWTGQDIGAVGIPGSSGYSGGTFTLQGSGNISQFVDAFQYAYKPLTGDGVIVARVASMQNTFTGSSSNTKAGVLIRESLADNAQFALVGLRVADITVFQSRLSGDYARETGGPSTPPPYWVKLVRQGNTFTGYVSPDGASWAQVGSPTTIAMGASVYIGLATATENNDAVTTATFDNVMGGSAPDFYLSNPGLVETLPVSGGTAYFTVNVNAINGLAGSTSLSVSSLPAGATAAFSPAAVTGAAASTLGVTTTSSTPAGTYTLTVTGVNGSLTRTTSLTLTVSASAPPSLPTPWANRDVGAAATPGSASYSAGTFTLTSFACCLWRSTTTDSFEFAYQPLNGDGTMVARVVGDLGPQSNSAGVMIRQSLRTDSTYALMAIEGGRSPAFEVRPANGGSTTTVGQASFDRTPPEWVKVVRQGSTFSGFQSTDGFNWTQIGSSTVAIGTNAFAGLVKARQDFGDSTPGTSTFDTVVVSSVPEFYLLASPASTTVAAGSSATYTVIAGYLNGFSGTVTFSLSGLPSGATASFSPPSLTGNGSSTLTVTTKRQNVGTFQLTITGTSGAMTRSVPVTLVVN